VTRRVVGVFVRFRNDGVADMFDLDADNDGIEDVIEAGLGSE
jgi:hypothetical protein